ncbi:hypothetical protein Amsp01_043370 [Amycolatopsis sp. NBRC 101858]|uniref:alpha/beta fold hydrolase n=1 Tax=Amycolatopsis sp. NBRC 101858 TaxID=3032200 RepID=UPI0024A33590|nr:alpha/beta fold hydrolase [Amycolatopsis sp. NBRC 101858]GLY38313.1 hypothetical protein Amsp01_043370 [Amycolatopsis sp. NBRC 101858]
MFYRSPAHPDAPTLAPDAQGLIWLPDEAFAAAFAQNASAEELAVFQAVQRPITPESITTPVGRPRWKDLPSWFLIAEKDRMIPAETQRFMAEHMQATVRTHPVDHAPLVTAPSSVTTIILEAADHVASGSPQGSE